MSAPEPNNAAAAGGRLFWGCTNLSAAAPFGGTEVGLVRDVLLTPSVSYLQGVEEEGGPGRAFVLTGNVVVGARLSEWNDDATNLLYPSTTTVGGKRVVQFKRAAWGHVVSELTNVVFRPHNTDHPGFVLYKALPLLEVNQQLLFSAYRFQTLSFVLLGRPLESGTGEDIGLMGPWSTLSLP